MLNCNLICYHIHIDVSVRQVHHINECMYLRLTNAKKILSHQITITLALANSFKCDK